MKIKCTSECSVDHTTCLVFGDSGIGKTTLASTLQDKTLIIGAEPGLLSLSQFKIDVVDLQENAISGKMSMSAADRIETLREYIVWLRNGTDYANIFVDSLTELSEVVLDYCDGCYPDARNSLQKWGLYKKTMQGIIKTFRDLPYNVFITSLAKSDKDDVGRKIILPDVMGSLSASIPQYFDFVFAMRSFVSQENDKESEVRYLQTFHDGMYVCKDRSGMLDRYIEADLQIITNKLGSKNGKREVEYG